MVLYGIFDRNYSSYQFVYIKFYGENGFGGSCVGFGVDGLALVFILLTSFIFVLIFLSA
jgi:NADH:ubiquinone oxidoreductase subunit 4 (subunit M)